MVSKILKNMRKTKPTYEEIEARNRELEKNMEDFELFRQMIENSLDPVFMIDDEENCLMIYVNEAARKHYGTSLDEIYTWRIPDWDPNYTYDKLLQHVEDIKRLKHIDIETHHRVNGNEIVPVEVSINLIKYKGHICHYGYIKNISERKKVEQALKDSNEKISLLMNSTAEGIYGIDLNGCCTYANKSCIELLGYKSEKELLGVNMHNLIHHSYSNKQPLDVENCKIYFAFKHGVGTHVDDEVFWRFDGTSFPVEYFSFPQFKNGQIVGAVVTFNDITERKLNESRIKKYNDELKELSATKDKFFSIIAHDLKNPFNTILGFLDLLTKELRINDIDTTEEQINIVYDSSKKVYNLLEDILLWASSQSGKIKFEPQKLNFADTCKEVVESLMLYANNKNITITHFITDKLSVYADSFMLKTVLRNLISNAIKFTNSNGRIDIHAEQTDSIVQISISDNGVGIAPENIKKLFDISQKYTTIGTANESGTGLGLLLCKDFIDKHQGKIWVESELGKGTQFFISIPA